MKNKHLEILFSDLDSSTQQRIASILATEICKTMRTPPISDPCADMEEFTETVLMTIYNIDPTVCETDLEELGEEAGIL